MKYKLLIAAALIASSAATAPAQEYPAKAVRIVVPFTPGAGNDTQGRLLARKFQESMGQSVIVDNPPGAAGMLGAELAAKAPADGYVLLFTTASISANATLRKTPGRSSPGADRPDEFTIDIFIRDLDAILDAVGVESVHYCGESLGGILGMPFAAERPRRVRTLTLIASRVRLNQSSQERYKFGHETWEKALNTLGSRAYSEAKNTADRFAPDTDPGLKNWFAEQQGSSRIEWLVALSRLARVIDTTPYLPRIEAPVLTIYPSHGPITTPEQEELLRKHVRDLRLVHLPCEYHNLHLTQAAACATHLLHFAAQHDGMACREP